MTTTIEKIQKQIADNKILIYMKGSPQSPSCGFSAKAIKVLSTCSKHFAYIDVLINEEIRSELPKFANWPTFPQLWIDGKLIGGSDILIDMYHSGELQLLIKKTLMKYNS